MTPPTCPQVHQAAETLRGSLSLGVVWKQVVKCGVDSRSSLVTTHSLAVLKVGSSQVTTYSLAVL